MILDSLEHTQENNVRYTITPLKNGDIRERSSIPCPEKDMSVMEYEEVWRVLPPNPGPGEGGKTAWIVESANAEGERKTFLGRVGGAYMALSGKEREAWKDREFGVRKEVWNERENKWRAKHFGDVSKVPSLSGVNTGSFEGEHTWREGEQVVILGQNYIVRAFRALE
jgi:hypothetical protein